jgi:hypothetical protein
MNGQSLSSPHNIFVTGGQLGHHQSNFLSGVPGPLRAAIATSQLPAQDPPRCEFSGSPLSPELRHIFNSTSEKTHDKGQLTIVEVSKECPDQTKSCVSEARDF